MFDANVEPTNNHVGSSLRDCSKSQTRTRNADGRRYHERIRFAIDTCGEQKLLCCFTRSGFKNGKALSLLKS